MLVITYVVMKKILMDGQDTHQKVINKNKQTNPPNILTFQRKVGKQAMMINGLLSAQT